jgi:hypothetical protein
MLGDQESMVIGEAPHYHIWQVTAVQPAANVKFATVQVSFHT